MNSPLHKQMSGFVKYIVTVALTIIVIATIPTFLSPRIIAAGEGLLKPSGTAETNISIWLPADSVKETVSATTDYIAEQGLPAGIMYPSGTISRAFTFGIWKGDGTTLREFSPSIVINVKYQDQYIPEPDRPEERSLHLHMYDPVAQSWKKLCGSVDVHENVVSAALSFATPFEENGSSLLAIALDNTPPLEQAVDAQGIITISPKGTNLRLQVPSGAVDVGSNFEITMLSMVWDTGSVKLLSKPADIKVCRIDQTIPHHNNRQIIHFSKPLNVGIDFDSETQSRAGGKANLTLATIQDDQWVDLEELGSRVVRGNDTITVRTTKLGTFGMATP